MLGHLKGGEKPDIIAENIIYQLEDYDSDRVDNLVAVVVDVLRKSAINESLRVKADVDALIRELLPDRDSDSDDDSNYDAGPEPDAAGRTRELDALARAKMVSQGNVRLPAIVEAQIPLFIGDLKGLGKNSTEIAHTIAGTIRANTTTPAEFVGALMLVRDTIDRSGLRGDPSDLWEGAREVLVGIMVGAQNQALQKRWAAQADRLRRPDEPKQEDIDAGIDWEAATARMNAQMAASRRANAEKRARGEDADDYERKVKKAKEGFAFW
jgi:hypothetical protein